MTILNRSVMSFYERAKTKVRFDSKSSEEFEAKVRTHKGSVCRLFFLQLW